MTDRATMQTSFQCAIAVKKGFISSDRGGGGLSNAWSVQPTTWDVGWGSPPLSPRVPYPPVDVVSCTLTTLHEQITF